VLLPRPFPGAWEIAAALACLLGFVWILVQTELEEIDLLQRAPGYREYMKKVPRYLPWLF
jgi:protein-S-isoprenylcysteine O-methyltransferase Ste14